ncbi:MAG: hypothetical protein AAGF24_09305, partial [Cyanobacteria bacterium P01_H01_bin.121]
MQKQYLALRSPLAAVRAVVTSAVMASTLTVSSVLMALPSQAIVCTAVLTANDPQSLINIHSGPGINYPVIGQGRYHDLATFINFTPQRGSQGYECYHVAVHHAYSSQ